MEYVFREQIISVPDFHMHEIFVSGGCFNEKGKTQ